MSGIPPRTGSEVSIAALDVSVSPHILKFGLGSRQAQVDHPNIENFSFKNRTRSDVWVAVSCIDNPSSSFKYSLSSDNSEPFVVKPGETKNVTIQLIITCTTKLKLDFVIKTWGEYSSSYKKAMVSFEVESSLSLKLDPDELKKEIEVGSGSFGIVYKGKYRGRNVAIKEMIDQSTMNSSDMRKFCEEASMCAKLRHENIVTFVGAVYIPERLCLVSEYAAYGSFCKAMEKYPESFDEALKVKCLLDASCALDFLHHSGISHRDLKPDNLLVVSLEPFSLVCVKLSDFGTTRDVDQSRTALLQTRKVGTPLFMAPEQLRLKKYDKSVDVYSFSFVMYTAFAGRYPFQDSSGDIHFNEAAVARGVRPEIPESWPAELVELMKKCWSGIPSERPSFEVIRGILEKYFEKLKCKGRSIPTQSSKKASEKEEKQEVISEGKKIKELSSRNSEILKKLTTSKLQTAIKWDGDKDSFADFCTLLKENKIRTTKLNLSNNEFEIKEIALLSDALETNTSLTSLCMDDTNFDDEGAKYLGKSLQRNSSLTALSLEDNLIGKNGMKVLCKALEENTNIKLRELWLYSNMIGTEGVVWLKNALKVNTSLTTLDIRRNAIKDDGASMIGELLKCNTPLTSLYLGGNGIGTMGLRALSDSLKVNTRLTTLNLDQNRIGDYGSTFLCEFLTVNTTLTELFLRGNITMTDDGKTKLKKLWGSRGKLEF